MLSLYLPFFILKSEINVSQFYMEINYIILIIKLSKHIITKYIFKINTFIYSN